MILWAGLWLAGAAHAGSLSVMPVVVGLSAQNVREAISVINRGDERTTVHVDVVSWTQADGRDVFLPTSDVVLNPGVFTLQPGQTQVLRLGWRGKGPVDTERTYRLLLREVPPAMNAAVPLGPAARPDGGPQVRVLLELRIPVYVAPEKAMPRSEWQVKRVDANAVEVRLRNPGNVHTVVRQMQVTAGAPLDTQAAVLAGQERRWILPLQQADGANPVVDVRTDQGRWQLPVED
ncbi:MAG: fimbria/pilus periplasmic chaperone [Burkholderiaceae bacterium]